jgi:serine protease
MLASFVPSALLALSALTAAPAYAVGRLPAVPNDPRWSQQWGLGDADGAGINVREAWRYGRGKATVIAVVDSGIAAHPEFRGRVLPGYDFVSSSLVANDGDGRDADPSDPGDWVTQAEATNGRFSEDCTASDSDWHGTHVAGIALAAAGNGIGIAGVAPLARLLPVRVVGKCGGTERDLVDGMRWAAGLEVAGAPLNNNPADVINLSLGSESECSSALQSAIDEISAQDIAIVAAVGNSAADASLQSPANCVGTATVSALTVNGTLARYSNFGSYVDLAAPGGDSGAGIISTVDRGRRGPVGPGYAVYQGTSMAAPHLSGLLAIARGYDPLTPFTALYEVLFANLAPFTSASSSAACSIGVCGGGALDAGLFFDALEARQSLIFERTLPTSVPFGESVEGVFTLSGDVVSDVAVNTPETCSYDGSQLTGLSRGVCTLAVQRLGTATEKPVDYVVNIEVGGRTPTMSHALPATLEVGVSARLNAVAESGGVLTYTSRTPVVCTVNRKGRMTAITRGTCRIRVNVAAQGDFDAGRLVVFTKVTR